MPSGPKVRVFFLWHLHQPWYFEPGRATARLPWVRLHALKNYLDFPALLSRDPRVPHVVNVVPSLLDQLELLAGGASDTFLDLARKPIASWSDTDRAFAARHFFSVHQDRHIKPVPRYAALHETPRDAFTERDLLDLTVHFHLAWCGRALRREPLVKALREQGSGFSEAEKNALLDLQSAHVSRVLPGFAAAFASGVVEATTSPYHHPILPLLCDTRSAREARPSMPIPEAPFQRPEDAVLQTRLGLATFARHFGFRPNGMWPPEGSLSEPVLAILGDAGVSWVATDEEILLQSLGRPHLPLGARTPLVFHPRRLREGTPAIFFRDRFLSDRIGFTYATWRAADAAHDIVAHLRALRRDANTETDELVVPVVLDGENPWESYEEEGEPFLTALTHALAAEPWIEVTTPSRLLRAGLTPRPLERLVAGSWIEGSFSTWIGDPVKNRAWELLTRARSELSPFLTVEGKVPSRVHAALLSAEASDFFWWFGEPHSSAEDPLFDELFRAQLSAAYRAAGKTPPAALEEPLAPEPGAPLVRESRPIAPTLDGRMTDYFEWLGAGRFLVRARGTMGGGGRVVKEVRFGLSEDGATLFLRLDPVGAFSGELLEIALLDEALEPHLPLHHHFQLTPSRSGAIAVGRIAELRLPAPPRGPSGTVGFRLVLREGEREIESIPERGFLLFRAARNDWSA